MRKCKQSNWWWFGFFAAFPLYFLGIPKAFVARRNKYLMYVNMEFLYGLLWGVFAAFLSSIFLIGGVVAMS